MVSMEMEMDRTRTAPDSWSDVPKETYKYNGLEQTINPSVSGQAAANDRGNGCEKSEGGPGRGYYLNGKPLFVYG